jgi:hypothetical protein
MVFDTPILIIIFNRPKLVQGLFDEIKKHKPKELFVFCDGARVDKPNELELLNKSKSIFEEQIDWDCKLETYYLEENKGAGRAICQAIKWFFTNVNQGIIIEEDCLPHSDFFLYCQELLNKYKDNKEVMLIGGNNLHNEKYINDSYYFSAYSHIWGWATWKETIDGYNFSLDNISNKEAKKILKSYFPTPSERGYWYDRFRLIKQNKINTWDYQLMFNIWKIRGVTIIPSVNLVKNCGFDKDSIHSQNTDCELSKLKTNPILPLKHPEKIIINEKLDRIYFKKYLYKPMILLLYRWFRRNFFCLKRY